MKLLTGNIRHVALMIMSVLLLVVLLLVIGQTRAENLVACLNEDIRATFVKMDYRGGQSVDHRAAELLSVLPEPEAFRLVGSVDRPHSTTVGFVTDLPHKDAEDLMNQALLDSGYESKPQNQRPIPERRGFRRAEAIRRAVKTILCNSLQDSAHASAFQTDVGVAAIVQFGGGACRNIHLRELTDGDGARSYLPDLILPQESQWVGGGGGGGGMNSSSSTTQFEIDQGIGEVHAHFARQMSEQGWNADASWSNDDLNGSTWSRIMQGGRFKLLGILEVYQSGDRFEAKINVSLFE